MLQNAGSLFLNMFSDWPDGTGLAILVCLALAVPTYKIFHVIFDFLNFYGVPARKDLGCIIRKQEKGGREEVRCVPIVFDETDVRVVIIPKSWYLKVLVEGRIGTVEVPEKIYQTFYKRERIQVECVFGRFWGVKIKGVSHA